MASNEYEGYWDPPDSGHLSPYEEYLKNGGTAEDWQKIYDGIYLNPETGQYDNGYINPNLPEGFNLYDSPGDLLTQVQGAVPPPSGGPTTPPPPGSGPGATTTVPRSQSNMNFGLTGPIDFSKLGSFQSVQDPRNAELYNLLMGRANQSLNVDPNDPAIKNAVNMFAAQQTRAMRDNIDALAERSGPNANLNAERRMMSENAGLATGQLASQLVINEITARRQEIMQALQLMGGLLTDTQQLALQRELGLINAQLQQYGLTTANDRFAAQMDFDWAKEDAYWDRVDRGRLGNQIG